MLPDEAKTKEQLIDELAELRQQVAELEILIREHKQVEDMLMESEEKYRGLVNNIKLGIFRSKFGPPGRYLEVNPALEEITGYSREELLQMDPHQLYVHPEEKLPFLDKVVRTPGKVSTEFKLRKKDGTEITVYSTLAATKDSKGKVLYFDGITEDITERKRVEKVAKREREQAEEYLNIAGVMLATVNANENITLINKKGCATLGYKEGELIGRNWFDTLVPQRISGQVRDVFHKLMAGEIEPVEYYENPLLTKNGEERIIAFHNTVIRDPGSQIVGVLFSGEDITERKRAEERERELQQELALTSRLAAIGELAAGVAHEMNNPLTGIIGLSQRLMRKNTNPELGQHLEMIHDEAQRAAKIVQNLLTFARCHELKKEYSDINDIVQSALELRAYELETSNIKVVTNLAPKLPEVIVDYNQIEEVFINIILNAEQAISEANEGDTLTIKTKEKKDYIRISFANNGPGIPTEQLDKVFNPFFTTREEKDGTGLGLSICHGIVTEHGGRIYAKSKPGQGAKFIIEIPLTTKEGD